MTLREKLDHALFRIRAQHTGLDHLKWIYERLLHQHGENIGADYMLTFKSILENLDALRPTPEEAEDILPPHALERIAGASEKLVGALEGLLAQDRIRSAVDALQTQLNDVEALRAKSPSDVDLRHLFSDPNWDVALKADEAKNGGWIEWHSGARPVHPDTLIEVKTRSEGVFRAQPAEDWTWVRFPHGIQSPTDIVAYRVVKSHHLKDTWYNWSGGENPCVPYNRQVEIELRCKKFVSTTADRVYWARDNRDDDVIAFRVLS